MDRAELRDRAWQEFAKRQDSVLAQLGYGFGREVRRSGARAGNFFFAAEGVEQILTLLRERLPGQAASIVSQAEKICRHRFDLLGYADLDFGRPMDWHLDPVHG
ncbi:MAG TPA: hypothetical protein VEJ00_04920, partial [Candidatus Acidoferrales bacterium]|nr:hypothetical protein [Candidatus Acidoferrales bacterium]